MPRGSQFNLKRQITPVPPFLNRPSNASSWQITSKIIDLSDRQYTPMLIFGNTLDDASSEQISFSLPSLQPRDAANQEHTFLPIFESEASTGEKSLDASTQQTTPLNLNHRSSSHASGHVFDAGGQESTSLPVFKIDGNIWGEPLDANSRRHRLLSLTQPDIHDHRSVSALALGLTSTPTPSQLGRAEHRAISI